MVFPEQVVVCINLHLPFLESALSPDLFSELGDLVPLDCGVGLVVGVAVVHVSFVISVHASQRPVILALSRVVSEELRPKVACDDAYTDCIAVVHQELPTSQVYVTK